MARTSENVLPAAPSAHECGLRGMQAHIHTLCHVARCADGSLGCTDLPLRVGEMLAEITIAEIIDRTVVLVRCSAEFPGRLKASREGTRFVIRQPNLPAYFHPKVASLKD